MSRIEKMIQASEKRLAKYDKNRSMYSERTDRHIAKANRGGADITREGDFTVSKNPRWKYDYTVLPSERAKAVLDFGQLLSICDNLERQAENEARYTDEAQALSQLKEQQRQEQEKAGQRQAERPLELEQRLADILMPFKQQWMQRMKTFHTDHYTRVHKVLEERRQLYRECDRKLFEMRRTSDYDTAEYNRIQDLKTECARIIGCRAARTDSLDTYIDGIMAELEDEFRANLVRLADKCSRFGIDRKAVRAHFPEVTPKGISVVLTDGKDRVVDARMIWAAEYSLCVAPHTRYIITERMLQPGQDIGQDTSRSRGRGR